GEQQHDSRRVQVHLLDGVCSPHVGEGARAALPLPCCLLCRPRLHQDEARRPLRRAVWTGRGAGADWLVDGEIWAGGAGQSPCRAAVSPYRLAAHLTSAFVIFSGIFWTALNVLFPTPPASTPAQLLAAAKLRPLVHPVAMLLGVTAFSGAFVAGNDAGRAFNTFPLMGDHWVPPEILELTPLHRNFFENTATVQFQHRVLAISTLAAVTGMWYSARKLPLHPRSALLLNTALGITALQVTLGISALLTYVPVSLGSAHQAGALTLFAAMLALMHSLRRPNAAASATAVRAATAAASKPA
ncbi:unnamed protein product, partial [Closterium sp. Yama58-4]